MSKARLVITAGTVEKRPVSAACGYFFPQGDPAKAARALLRAGDRLGPVTSR